MKRHLVMLLALLLIVALPLTPVAAQAAESIRDFSVEIIIDDSGFANVRETIVYDFAADERHGIRRNIPLQYIVEGDTGYQLSGTFSAAERLVDGSFVEEPHLVESNGPQELRVRIGSESLTHTGEQTYRLTYQIGPLAIASDDGQAIVRFDAPGTGWDVPVSNVDITIDAPSLPTATNCYSGALFSTDAACSANVETVSSSGALAAGETITAEYVFDIGTFNSYAELETIDNSPSVWPAIAIGGVMLASFGLFGVRPLVGYVRYRQRRTEELVIPQYEPPKDLTPSELGLLVDNSSSGAELSATIIHLAVKGRLKIIQTKPKKWFRRARYDLLKQDGKAALSKHANDLYEAIFKSGDRISVDDLAQSTAFQKANRRFHKKLKKNLQRKGFYKPANIFAFDLSSRMTESGYDKWAEVEGFREFLNVTQADRMAFHDAPERTPEQFSQYLPYAVALGVEEQWAKQFKDLELTTEWYEGSEGSAFTAGNVSSLSGSLHSAAASANRSSGTSGSGGGFSGGGFGGGGGGSW